MEHAFAVVVFVVAGVGIVGAIASLLLGRRSWDEYASKHLLLDTDVARGGSSGSADGRLERDTEIREMLEARNARRRRRGESEIDVESELVRLTATAPQIDAGLREEIRELVIARNHRRARQGKPPLDVAAEIEREIASLSGV